jgi:hypothetical protein
MMVLRDEQVAKAGEHSSPRNTRVCDADPISAYNEPMNGLVIYVDWQYFLGILGALIGMAYYANGRFTKIETTVEWLKKLLLEIKADLEARDSWESVNRPRRSRPRRNSN